LIGCSGRPGECGASIRARAGSGATTERSVDPDLHPNADQAGVGLSRRRLLASGVAAGTIATAGCAGGGSGADGGSGDGTASVVDSTNDEVVETRSIGLTASFPSNQYSPGLTDSPEDPLWLNVDRGVRGLSAGSLSEVVDLSAGTVVRRIDLGGSAFVGTWDPAHETLYVPVQTSDEVAVIDHAAGEITSQIDVGPQPYGATAATVRPDSDGTSNAAATLAGLAFAAGTSGTTYCIGNCGCDHQL